MESSGVNIVVASEEHAPKAGAGQRLVRILVEVALTLAALFGVLVSGITVVAAHIGVKPLVVRSGSMEPTIATGSMVLTRKVDALEVRIGDIVAVERPDRTRVTHRVIALQRQEDAVALTLKGDANKDPDPFPVTVRTAGRVVGQVRDIGRVMAWLASAKGGFLLGCLCTGYAMRVVSGRSQAHDA